MSSLLIGAVIAGIGWIALVIQFGMTSYRIDQMAECLEEIKDMLKLRGFKKL